MLLGGGYGSNKNGDDMTLQKWDILVFKNGGINNSEKYGLKGIMIKCQEVNHPKIIRNYQDFSIAS